MSHCVPTGLAPRIMIPCLWLLLAGMLACSGIAAAATINVSGTSDEDSANTYCSLREAIRSAREDSCYKGCSCGVGSDTIQLPLGTYYLTLGELEITGDANYIYIKPQITNARPSDVVIDANYNHRVFSIHDNTGVVYLERLTISKGRLYYPRDSDLAGAGLSIVEAEVSLSRCNVEYNVAEYGGGASVTMGTLRVYDSAFYSNQVEATDGGSTHGGAVHLNTYGILRTLDSTFSGNAATGNGGAIYISGLGEAWLRHTTVTNNYCGYFSSLNGSGCGVAVWNSGFLNLAYTLLAKNIDLDATSPDYVDCYSYGGTVTSYGANLVGDATGCSITAGPYDQLGTTAAKIDPLLREVQRNSQGTWSHKPRQGSPAVDAGWWETGTDFDQCDTSDQQYQSRPSDGNGDLWSLCDAGAVELIGLFSNGFESGNTSFWGSVVGK